MPWHDIIEKHSECPGPHMAPILQMSSYKTRVSETVVGISDERRLGFGNAKRDDTLASNWVPFTGSMRHAVTVLSVQVSLDTVALAPMATATAAPSTALSVVLSSFTLIFLWRSSYSIIWFSIACALSM